MKRKKIAGTRYLFAAMLVATLFYGMGCSLFEEPQMPDLSFLTRTPMPSVAAPTPTVKVRATATPSPTPTVTLTPTGNAFDPSTGSGSEQGITSPTPDPVREVNEYVWTIQRADIMSNAVSKSDEKQIGGEEGRGFVLVTVEEGERLKRTGIHENGMSRVEFEGYTGFIDSAKISTAAPTSTPTPTPTPTPKGNAFDPSTGSGSEQGITGTGSGSGQGITAPTPTPKGNAFDPSTGSGSEQGITGTSSGSGQGITGPTPTPKATNTPVPTATLYPEITGNVVKTETNDYGKGEIGTTEYYSDGSSVEKVTVPGKGISTITILADGTRIEEADYEDYKTIMYPNDVLWIIQDNGITLVNDYGTGNSYYIKREQIPFDGAIIYFRYPEGQVENGENAYICNSDGSKNKWSNRLYDVRVVTFGGGTKTVNLWGMDGVEYKLNVDDGPFYDY